VQYNSCENVHDYVSILDVNNDALGNAIRILLVSRKISGSNIMNQLKQRGSIISCLYYMSRLVSILVTTNTTTCINFQHLKTL
jgi:hypothetical protein